MRLRGSGLLERSGTWRKHRREVCPSALSCCTPAHIPLQDLEFILFPPLNALCVLARSIPADYLSFLVDLFALNRSTRLLGFSDTVPRTVLQDPVPVPLARSRPPRSPLNPHSFANLSHTFTHETTTPELQTANEATAAAFTDSTSAVLRLDFLFRSPREDAARNGIEWVLNMHSHH